MRERVRERERVTSGIVIHETRKFLVSSLRLLRLRQFVSVKDCS